MRNPFAALAEKWRTDASFRRGVYATVGTAAALGGAYYAVRRSGYKRGYEAGYGEARTEEALMLETRVGRDEE